MIYFVKSHSEGNPIKIGYTADKNLPVRLTSLQVSSPHKMELLGIIHGGRAEERELHVKFAESHIRGEWFKETKPLSLLIRKAASLLSAMNQKKLKPAQLEAMSAPADHLGQPDLFTSAIKSAGFSFKDWNDATFL